MTHRRALLALALAPLFSAAFSNEASAQTPQSARGPLAVLGLRAPHGDDEAAQNMTSALRRAGTAMGFAVPTDSPSLEQSIALHEVCTDQPQPECLRAIARSTNSQRLLYGTIRRATRSSDAELRIQIRLYDLAASTISDAQEASVSGTQGRDQDILLPIARRMVEQLAPPPAAVVVTPPPPVVTPPPPVITPPSEYVPIRRYIGFGAIGLGGAMLVGGVISGVLWLGFNAEQQLATSAWSMYQPYPQDDRRSTDGAAICDAVQRTEVNRFGTGSAEQLRPELLRVCATHGSMQGAQWGLIAAGVAVAAAGVVLVVTDRPPPRATTTTTGSTPGPITRRPDPVRFGFAPVLSPQTQGAAMTLQF